MTWRPGRLAAAAVLVVLLAFRGRASAQVPTIPNRPAFDVDRLAPAIGAGGFVVVEDGDVLAPRALVVHGALGLLGEPLVVRDVMSGATLTTPVAVRVGLDMGVAFGLTEDLQVGLALPLALYQGGDRLRGLDLPGGERDLAPATQGDVRLSGKWRLVAPARGLGRALAVALILTLPTGNDDQFAGEAGFVVEPRLCGSYRREGFAVAVNLGLRFRTQEVRFLAPDTTLGNELGFGIGASAQVPGLTGLDGVVEIAGARGDHGVSPAEARLGARLALGSRVTALALAGVGLGDDVGVPAWRFGVDVRFEPRGRRDRDKDGIADAVDGCPREAEDDDGVEDGDGCPDLDDDQDGVDDESDRCPDDAEDRDRYLDDDGCPEVDNDGDGVLDAVDACPDDAKDRCVAPGTPPATGGAPPPAPAAPPGDSPPPAPAAPPGDAPPPPAPDAPGSAPPAPPGDAPGRAPPAPAAPPGDSPPPAPDAPLPLPRLSPPPRAAEPAPGPPKAPSSPR
jgi:hypothetical protein